MTLIDRLRHATGPSKELNSDIAIAVGEAPDDTWTRLAHSDGFYNMDAGCWVKGGLIRTPKSYTSSIDAALALVAAKSGEEMAIGCLRHATGEAMIQGHSAKMIPINMLVIWLVRYLDRPVCGN
jgi:hypothetical protein